MSDGAETIGAMATAGLLAREIERAHADRPAVGHDEHKACANCGTIRNGPYCHKCGQAGHVHRNLMALVHDIAHGVFHFEGKIWNTLPMLIRRPGELTRRYVMGERAKFVSPMALFLFSVFLIFAVVSNVGGHAKPGDKKKDYAVELAATEGKLEAARHRRANETDAADQAELDQRITELSAQAAALKAVRDHGMAGIGKAIIDSSHASVAAQREQGKTVEDNPAEKIPYIGGMIRHAAENPELVVYKMKNYAYKYSWALIPISVPFIWLLFCFRRDVGLYDHAIFAIYSLSFMSLAVVALVILTRIGLPGWIIPLAAIIVPPIHIYKQLKGAYGLGRWSAGWRTFALLIITSITLSLFSSFVFYMGSD